MIGAQEAQIRRGFLQALWPTALPLHLRQSVWETPQFRRIDVVLTENATKGSFDSRSILCCTNYSQHGEEIHQETYGTKNFPGPAEPIICPEANRRQLHAGAASLSLSQRSAAPKIARASRARRMPPIFTTPKRPRALSERNFPSYTWLLQGRSYTPQAIWEKEQATLAVSATCSLKPTTSSVSFDYKNANFIKHRSP